MAGLARHRSMSTNSNRSKARQPTLAEVSMPTMEVDRFFEPCAATASHFLYAQGNSVVCAHHDTLAIERRFSRHSEEIQLLAVDTVSERGAGRLVVSYDAGQTAIVWDCQTGDELARFASYEILTVAAWMRNGNVAFGNCQGNVILFEPTTSEHISARTIDQIPITALAPAADCRTYAIGFSNGSLLIAALQPRFTILHNLTTSRGPSPIITLAWHASSSRQKSDMLATQTNDGDLRVWSVAKSSNSNDTAKVVRVLKRAETFQAGPNWLGWSKNGHIIQYSEGQTSSWDVRTKHVTYETVPTLDHVRGLALYGPGATLFTIGPNNTAQQFDLNTPPTLVANVQHPATLLPPSPPVSVEELKKQDGSVAARKELSAVPINIDVSSSDDDHMSPLARIAREMDKVEQHRAAIDRTDTLSPVSSRSHTSNSTSSKSSADSAVRVHGKHASSISRGTTSMSDATSISFGSSIHTGQPSVMSSRESVSLGSVSSSSQTSHRRRGGSRLRHEVQASPHDTRVTDLFKFTRARLSDIPYRHPQALDNSHMTNHDLRRQMLSTIFGWDGEADSLIQDELSRHRMGSSSRVLLSKWLGEIDTDIMTSNVESMTSSDWMLLALSGIGGTASQAKVARAYVQRLLEKEDVHTGATIMIGMGDQNDAIEIYVSHKRWMEALILTCLVFPADWQRQSELVRKWGEWAVQHGQQQLAIRCFSCTGSESSEPWSSPGAQQATFTRIQSQSIPEILSPPLSPPSARGPQRSIAKTSALKLVTAFVDNGGNSKFFGLGGDNERTPMNAQGRGVTPIAESALSPTGGDTAATAFPRLSNRSVYDTPASARTATPGGFKRQRLPSIGEMPSDAIPRVRLEALAPDSGSDREKDRSKARAQPENLKLSSAAYTPTRERAPSNESKTQRKAKASALPSPSPDTFNALKQTACSRNGSRDRKPDGLQIQWPPMESIITGDYMSSPPETASSRQTDVFSTASSRRTAPRSVASLSTSSVAVSSRSPAMSDRSYTSGVSPVMGRSLDQYISSLDSAQHHAHKSRHSSRERKDKTGRTRSSSRKPKVREPSEDRGRSGGRHINPAKRSPTSPIPMSPEDLRGLGAFLDDSDVRSDVRSTASVRTNRDGSRVKTSRGSSKLRRSSIESAPQSAMRTKPNSRISSCGHSRRPSSPDDRMASASGRGRSKGRTTTGSALRSPSSPLPMSMSPQAKHYVVDEDDDEEELKLAHEARKRFRSRKRSSSRHVRGSSAVRDPSADRRYRARSSSRRSHDRDRSKSRPRRDPSPEPKSATHIRSYSEQKWGNIKQIKDERALKREQAARELEERRKSLANRPSAPPIPHPTELSPIAYRPSTNFPETSSQFGPTTRQGSSAQRSRNASPSPKEAKSAGQSPHNTVPVGLPATPRAMRHPKFDADNQTVPDVPQLPDRFDSAPPPSLSRSSMRNGRIGSSEVQYNNAFESLTLPKTTYQAAPRRLPSRSASAPIPEEPMSQHLKGLPAHPSFQSLLSPSSKQRQEISQARSTASTSPTTHNARTTPSNSGNVSVLTGIAETLEANQQPLNPQNNDLVPPPPPPPPLIPELQHLARPPPPPPPPLYRPPHGPNTHSVVSGVSGVSSGSGVIEILMDEDDESKPEGTTHAIPHPTKPKTPQINTAVATTTSGISPPHRTGSRNSHTRHQSENDNSISGRISRAADRLRSASRGRHSATKSPPSSAVESSPYDQFPPVWARPTLSHSAGSPPSATIQQFPQPPPIPENRPNFNSKIGDITRDSFVERHPREVKAAALKAMEMEGGMI